MKISKKERLDIALELLDDVLDIFDELDGITWDEDSSFQYSSYSDLREEITEFIEENE